MKITSNQAQVNASKEEVFHFLKDMNNIIHLLPQDNVSDFKSTDKECSFKVQGGVVISLVQTDLTEFSELKMKSGEKSPFPFNLTISLNDKGDATIGHIDFDGQVNMFLKMMVEKPLTNLFNYMSSNITSHFEEEK